MVGGVDAAEEVGEGAGDGARAGDAEPGDGVARGEAVPAHEEDGGEGARAAAAGGAVDGDEAAGAGRDLEEEVGDLRGWGLRERWCGDVQEGGAPNGGETCSDGMGWPLKSRVWWLNPLASKSRGSYSGSLRLMIVDTPISWKISVK